MNCFKNYTILALTAFILTPSHSAFSNEKAKFTLNWSVAHGPYELVEKATQQFKSKVEERTNGAVQVAIQKHDFSPYYLNYVSNKKSLDDLVSGKVQMGQIYTNLLGLYHSKMYVLSLPFLFENDDHVFKALDGEAGKELSDGLLKNTGVLRALAYTYCGGFRVLPTAGIEIKTVEDFSKLTLAYPDSPVTKDTYDLLKVKTYATQNFETIKNTKSNLINGFVSTYPRYSNSGEMSVAKVVNETRETVLISNLIINEEFYKSLPENFQTIISEEALSAAKTERAESIRIGDEIRKKANGKNFKVVKLSKEEIEKAKNLTASVYEKYTPIFGSELIKTIIDSK